MSKEISVFITKTSEYRVEVDDDLVIDEYDGIGDQDAAEFFSNVEATEDPVAEDWDDLRIEDDEGNSFNF